MALSTIHVALRTNTAPRAWAVIDEFGKAPVTCLLVSFGLIAVASTPVAGPRDLSPTDAGELAVKVALYLGVAVMVLIATALARRPVSKP